MMINYTLKKPSGQTIMLSAEERIQALDSSYAPNFNARSIPGEFFYRLLVRAQAPVEVGDSISDDGIGLTYEVVSGLQPLNGTIMHEAFLRLELTDAMKGYVTKLIDSIEDLCQEAGVDPERVRESMVHPVRSQPWDNEQIKQAREGLARFFRHAAELLKVARDGSMAVDSFCAGSTLCEPR